MQKVKLIGRNADRTKKISLVDLREVKGFHSSYWVDYSLIDYREREDLNYSGVEFFLTYIGAYLYFKSLCKKYNLTVIEKTKQKEDSEEGIGDNKMTNRDCCYGCKFCVDITEENPSGCSNLAIDPDWCLNENRPKLKGIYYE